MFGRSKGLVGLDIGSSAVKAVELAASGKSYRVVPPQGVPLAVTRPGNETPPFFRLSLEDKDPVFTGFGVPSPRR